MTDTNITVGMQRAFEAMCSGEYDSFALFSCFVNGEPAAAIVNITDKDGKAQVEPLFVSITPGRVLTDHNGREAEELKDD